MVIALPYATTVHAQFNEKEAARQPAANISTDWYHRALKGIQAFEDQIQAADTEGCFNATNMRSHTGFTLSPSGYTVQAPQAGWAVNFQLRGIGRSSIQWVPDQSCTITHAVDQLSYNFNNIQIEYINNKEGLRQNFLVKRKMPGDGDLKVTIEPITDLQPRLLGPTSLAFFNASHQQMLVYEDLNVWDANNKKLPAAMHYNNGLLTIEVDDSGASYPLTIDPLNRTPEWSTSADGLLSSLPSLQINSALYGYAVSGLGDVNGDGYGDAAISAPGLTNIFSGNGSLLSVGAVFVFYGSPTGLSTTPAKTLQPNTCVAGALFGTSVDAGDVTGDGINDIIIGAPLDAYSTTVAGSLGTVNVKAGKIYVYPGGNTPATNPAGFIEIKLQGATFFSNGIAGLLASNISANALFGFSVAATDDLDGDNRSDIVVGAPGYLGVGLNAVQNGAAFVYFSGNLSTTSPVHLQAPAASLFGLTSFPNLLNSGLLFGFSVDGAGDYNSDGKADIVVGAPAGMDLSSLGGLFNGQVLGGTAHIYYGTGAGVNNTAGTTLKAGSGSLMGNAANLFGYKVKGIKGAGGARNGNVAIGAPLGGLLSNTLHLTIQSGNVHIFRKQAGAPAGAVTSDQVLESPRSTHLLSILNSLDLNVLFGAAIDNAYDVNCDGYPDLVIGEPLSSGATLLQLQANAVGGAVYVFLGNASGTYGSAPQYTVLAHHGTEFLSVNAVSLFGFSVAGVAHTRGVLSAPRILAGSPAAALDYDNSLLNLGSTLGLTFNFLAGDNGTGKSFLFNPQLCIGESPLPVILSAFKGEEKNGVINLWWKTSREENLNRFEVERSRDGMNYEPIGIVFPSENATHVDYAFSDKNAHYGSLYYRLKMVDNDGSYKYSNILTFSVTETSMAKVAVAPNPVVDRVCIHFTGLSENTYRIELRNIAGQKVAERPVTITRYRQTEYLMRTASMAPGIYFLTLFDKSYKQVATSKVIVP